MSFLVVGLSESVRGKSWRNRLSETKYKKKKGMNAGKARTLLVEEKSLKIGEIIRKLKLKLPASMVVIVRTIAKDMIAPITSFLLK